MWVISLGLVLLQSVIFVNGVFEQMDKTYFVDTSRDVRLYSPNFPATYDSGSSARFTFKTQLPLEIRLSCTIDIYKDPSGCRGEYFYVSLDADPNLIGAKQYCGKGDITLVSEFNTLSIAYISKAQPGSGIGGTFACTVSAREKACDCGWSQQSRIVGGSPASITKYPSVVGIADTSSNNVFCDGSIISARTVLSAAHCVALVPNQSAKNVYIRAGTTNLLSTTNSEYAATYLVAAIIKHPSYIDNASTQLNDIALFITSSNIVWSRGVGPVCLPMNTASTFDYKNAIIAGWGTTSFAGPRSNTLLEADVNIIRNADCQGAYPGLQSTQVCTYAQGRDACQLDSGGPVFIRATNGSLYLCGIISYGKNCGGTTAGVNTRITTFIDWILNNAKATICNKPYR